MIAYAAVLILPKYGFIPTADADRTRIYAYRILLGNIIFLVTGILAHYIFVSFAARRRNSIRSRSPAILLDLARPYFHLRQSGAFILLNKRLTRCLLERKGRIRKENMIDCVGRDKFEEIHKAFPTI